MNTHIARNWSRAACALAITALLAAPVLAQERATQSEEAQVKVKKVVRVAPVEASADATAALRADIQRCGARCLVGGSGTISAGGGTTLDYSCDDDGNCACFGASDCVKMSDICKEGTIGCNDQGCICEQGSGDDGG
ncbi:MAG: hypothetical protein HKN58_02670 [Xanthomonadales bacterium]|nr:hypothetical protein [Xanthomonadales bacterium]